MHYIKYTIDLSIYHQIFNNNNREYKNFEVSDDTAIQFD